jgi:tRNA (guanine-N7-)-methyltransferase
MKPKDLKCPFRWETRRPLIFDRVLFVPTHYDKHCEWEFPGFTDATIFGNAHPILVEYCSGNGDWIAAKALQFPHFNWIAVEKRFDRVRKIWSKMQNKQINNLWIVCGEALTFSRFYLPPESIDEVFVNFPDPWPKRGHAKHRLIQTPFVEECTRIVKPGGNMTLVTDDGDYSQQMIHVLTSHACWASRFPDPHYTTNWPGYGDSFFETLWRAKGCVIRYHQFERKGIP